MVYINRLYNLKWVLMVRRSKLEIYVGVLKILATQGPMNLTQLTHNVGLSQSTLKQRLDFLIKQNLAEEKSSSGEEIFYDITGRGLKVQK